MSYEQLIKSRLKIHKALCFVQILMIFQICIGIGFALYSGIILHNIEQVLAGGFIVVVAAFIWMAMSSVITSNLQIIHQLEELQKKENEYENSIRIISQ